MSDINIRSILKRFLCGTGLVISSYIFLLARPPLPVQAQDSLYIDGYDVEVEINEDSSFDVTEKITYRATGEYHRVWRSITLTDDENYEKCKADPSLQCGGFSTIEILEVLDEHGRQLSEDEYEISTVYENSEERMKILWEYAPNGRKFNDETLSWTIKYRVFGGIGYFDTYDLFYWNIFYWDRDYRIENPEARIIFPKDVDIDDEDVVVYGNFGSYNWAYDQYSHTLTLDTNFIPAYSDFTALVKFPKGVVHEYSGMRLDLKPKNQEIYVDNVQMYLRNDVIDGIIPGERRVRFEASGYHSEEMLLDFEPGETKDLAVELEMTDARKLMIAGLVSINALSCIGGLVLLYFVVSNYLKKGRDIGRGSTVVPWFHPPGGISPVVVGSIKDERVHLVDITSTIINAAVRGFIKIKEYKKKEYELIKLKDFESGVSKKGNKINYKVLGNMEVRILNDIFGQKERIKTKDLKNKFYKKLPGIRNAIYEEMQKRDYFEKRPDKVRGKHLGIGFAMLFGGILLTGLSIFSVFTCGPMIALSGVLKIVLSFFMPSKTKKGTELYEKCKGFRMYLHTAERFRVQKLTPQTFERYLPYAMVFGVENEWAMNFKDIYDEPPEWYEGYGSGSFSPTLFTQSITRMNRSVSGVMASTPSSSGSSSGGGWSGGGGFSGGFSGGGGGGGGGGMS
ncbi:DUF2207 domain-containing protein [Candidatus Dojkabacteria bacterium]|nr:DUF2207 domain-containing protein [Candidatus Dojkabacteria bacterium]